MKFVNRDTLAAYLIVEDSALHRWALSGLLEREVRVGHQARFPEASVNAFLAANVHGYEQPPTLADLQARRVRFMTVEQAEKLHPLPAHRWRTLAREGIIRSFRIRDLASGPVRLDHASVNAYIAMLKSSLSYQEVLHVIGNNHQGLRRSIEQGLLMPSTRSMIIDHRTRFSRVSVLNCLQRWIVTTITPEDWLEQRLSSRDELLGTEAVARAIGFGPGEVWALIARGRPIHALKAYGSDIFKIDPESVRAYRQRSKPLTLEEISRVFGVTPQVARVWIYKSEILACPLHKHSHQEAFYRWCLCAYLEGRCSPAVYPARWIDLTLRPTAEPLIEESEAARRFGVPAGELQRRRKAGELRAVLLPTGVWKYRVSQLRNRRW